MILILSETNQHIIMMLNNHKIYIHPHTIMIWCYPKAPDGECSYGRTRIVRYCRAGNNVRSHPDAWCCNDRYNRRNRIHCNIKQRWEYINHKQHLQFPRYHCQHCRTTSPVAGFGDNGWSCALLLLQHLRKQKRRVVTKPILGRLSSTMWRRFPIYSQRLLQPIAPQHLSSSAPKLLSTQEPRHPDVRQPQLSPMVQIILCPN